MKKRLLSLCLVLLLSMTILLGAPSLATEDEHLNDCLLDTEDSTELEKEFTPETYIEEATPEPTVEPAAATVSPESGVELEEKLEETAEEVTQEEGSKEPTQEPTEEPAVSTIPPESNVVTVEQPLDEVSEMTQEFSDAEAIELSDEVMMLASVSDFEVSNGVLVAWNGNDRNLVIPDNLGITSIASDAFADKKDILQSVKIPEGVTVIGTAFKGCSNLTSVEFPNSLTTIGEHAFEGCTNLASIDLPASLINLGGSAFKRCTSLTSIKIPDSVAFIDYFDGIGSGVFSGCSNLTNAVLPNSWTGIPLGMFEGCTNLRNIVRPDSLTLIDDSAFKGCMAFPMFMYWLTHKEKWFIKCILPMAIAESNITGDILATARCSIDNAKIKSVMPQNESCENLCKYQNPVLVMAAEKDCLFPAKGVLLKAQKVWTQSKTYLLKDRGHINELTNEEKKMIIGFLIG